jgi:predicted metal-dependent hydrolase
MFNYHLERSIRRTLSIQIKPDSTILVKAPLFLPQSEIDKFINSKSLWIEKSLKKISKQATRNLSAIKHTYQEGDKFLYLGTEYPLQVSDVYKQKLLFNEAFIIPSAIAKRSKKAVKTLITSWYKKRAKDLLAQRLMIYSSNNSLPYEEFRLTSAKTRWGVCTSHNNIRLNWKLIMAPLDVLDYVVVHELCHTVNHNHSKAFWLSVENILPDHKLKKKWLKENGHTLTV